MSRLVALALALLAFPAAAQQLAPTPAPAPAPAPDARLEELLRANTHPIALENGRLTGSGAELLLRTMADDHVVALTESHNDLATPGITAALFRQLHERYGFNYLALEQDPVTMRTVSARPYRGDLARIGELARRRPFSFTFATDQELALIAEAGRVSTGRHRPVWGCEQAFGVTHVLEALEPRAPGAAARSHLRRMLEPARLQEGVRYLSGGEHLMSKASMRADVARLRELMPQDAETRFLIDALDRSQEIYGHYRNGDAGRLPGYWSNSRVREEYMKEICAAEYKAAQQKDGRPPKVLMKFGGWHVYEVNSPANLSTLGTFFSAVSKLNGAGYTSVGVLPTAWDGKPLWEVDPFLGGFRTAVSRQGWRLIDLRPFREYPNYDLLRTGTPGLDAAGTRWLGRTVYGLDFLLLIGPAGKGTFQASGIQAAKPAS